MKCDKCNISIRPESKYCHSCGLFIDYSEYGSMLCDQFEQRQRRAYRLLPRGIRRRGKSAGGCIHYIQRYSWTLIDFMGVLRPLVKKGLTFFRTSIGLSISEHQAKLIQQIQIKPNSREESETWDDFVLRTSNEIEYFLPTLYEYLDGFGRPFSNNKHNVALIEFCDEYIYEDWWKQREDFVRTSKTSLPRSGQLSWWFEPFTIDELRRRLREDDPDESPIRELHLIRENLESIPENFFR